MRKIFLAFIVSLISLGCSSEWDLSLHSQPIKDSSLTLYHYDAWGGRDTHIEGYVLLDSTETFDMNEVNISDASLPFYNLDGRPKSYEITGVSWILSEEVIPEKLKKFTPDKKLKSERKGIKILTKQYQQSGFLSRSGGYWKYEFESFKETVDSLFFYNLDEMESIEKMHLDVLKIRKGDIKIARAENSKLVNYIYMEDLKLKPNTDEIISNVTYQLTPKKQMSVNEFSDYGIFKEVLVKRK